MTERTFAFKKIGKKMSVRIMDRIGVEVRGKDVPALTLLLTRPAVLTQARDSDSKSSDSV